MYYDKKKVKCTHNISTLNKRRERGMTQKNC